MKRHLVLVALLVVATSAFASDPVIAGTVHAVSGIDRKDTRLAVLYVPDGSGATWLNTDHSIPLLSTERDRLAELLRVAADKIDTAIANKTTISLLKKLGAFGTENGCTVTVSFQTGGYEFSYAVIDVEGQGHDDLLLFNREDCQDLLGALGKVRSFGSDYQKQAALF